MTENTTEQAARALCESQTFRTIRDMLKSPPVDLDDPVALETVALIAVTDVIKGLDNRQLWSEPAEPLAAVFGLLAVTLYGIFGPDMEAALAGCDEASEGEQT